MTAKALLSETDDGFSQTKYQAQRDTRHLEEQEVKHSYTVLGQSSAFPMEGPLSVPNLAGCSPVRNKWMSNGAWSFPWRTLFECDLPSK